MNFLRKSLSSFLIISMIGAACLFTGCANHETGSKSTEVSEPESESETVQETESVADRLSALLKTEAAEGSLNWDKLYTHNGLLQYEDENFTSKAVIDFSKMQTVNDWKKVKASGVDGVILKIGSRGFTEGSIVEDSTFAENYRNAVDNDVLVYGVYFFSQAVNTDEAIEEAYYVEEALKEAGVSKDVVVFYDLETGISGTSHVKYRNFDLKNKEIRANLDAFAEEMDKAGYVTGVYSNLRWHNRHLKRSLFKGYPFWYACYKDTPTLKKNLTVWQYSAEGLVKGISGHVDLNVVFELKEGADVDASENSGDSSETVAESDTVAETTQGTTEAVKETAAKTTSKKITWNSDWEYASYSEIHDSSAVLYYSPAENRRDIVVAVNAGHGTPGGESVKTQCHPDGSAKVTGGSTGEGSTMATSINSGTTLLDGTAEATVNLQVAKLVRKKLLAAGYDVLMLRSNDDCQLDNIARTVMANNNADCHISIHYDSTENDKGFFYIGVPDVDSYRSMEPVASHWQQHNALGSAVLSGMEEAGCNIYSSGTMALDLTQTSYSTIPSVDLEVGDRASAHDTETLEQIATGIVKGIENYFA